MNGKSNTMTHFIQIKDFVCGFFFSGDDALNMMTDI